MTIFRNVTDADFRFKQEVKSQEPFPPSYYENKKRAGELIRQMTTPKWDSKPHK